MKILFVHQNFPGQFGRLAHHLGSDSSNEVVALRAPRGSPFPHVKVISYEYPREPLKEQHPLLIEMEAKLLRAEAAATSARTLKEQGFTPDVIVAHSGWGEAIFLKDIWPTAKLVGYMEYFYRAEGQDAGFDPEFSARDDTHMRLLRWKNAASHLLFEQTDACVSPTQWQRSTYPSFMQSQIQVQHDGIDTEFFAPDAKASVTLAKAALRLTARDEVISFVSLYLEPIRGFHTFMRALPAILAARPKAHVLILGSDQPGYMNLPAGFRSYKEMMLATMGRQIDPARVHFLGPQSRDIYRSVLQISSAHVYLTYPFVLSWSMLEAMSTGVRLFASSTPPVTEFVTDGENGTLFEFSTEALTTAVCDGLAKAGRGGKGASDAARMRKKARERILPLARPKAIAGWEELLRGLLPTGAVAQTQRVVGASLVVEAPAAADTPESSVVPNAKSVEKSSKRSSKRK